MSRAVDLVLLAEDEQHRCFLRRFLRRVKFEARIRQVNLPAGGSKEQAVRDRFPAELAALRSRKVASRALVVMVDADKHSVAERREQLAQSCHDQAPKPVAPPRPDDAAFFVIPKWEIETWLAYLRGERPVDENRRDYPKHDHESACQAQVDALAEMCEKGRLPSDAPPSLVAACDEFARFRSFRAGLG